MADLPVAGRFPPTGGVKGGEPVPAGASTDPTRGGIAYVTAGGAGKDLHGFGPGVHERHESNDRNHDHDHIASPHRTRARLPAPGTVEWSGRGCGAPASRSSRWRRGRYVAEAGTSPKPKVSALAASGERVDCFEIRRGR
ncbi:hypothetical protein ACWDZ4_09180 [Streptomyces sp. NPDC003016]